MNRRDVMKGCENGNASYGTKGFLLLDKNDHFQKTERFVGDDEANELLTRTYREGH